MALKPISLKIPKAIRILQPTVSSEYQAYIGRVLKELKGPAKKIAQEKTPVGATGLLQKKVVESSSNFRISIEWTAAHAPSVQYGAKRHWAPLAPLRLWAFVKLGNPNLAYKIRWKIARRGTPAKRFLESARSAISREIVPMFRERMRFLAKLLSGGFR